MSEVIQEAVNPYSRLISWEVWNFMSIEHGKCEFDEKNIINLKGYNDSGKSAMIQALKVLVANTNPTKQVNFIQDDKEYFRILATFSDGVQILRDKYINGQSLYEMYQNGQCIYTTKSGKALSKIVDVPQPIADYLGLIMYDGVCLNARTCFEKQIGVQTTGSENYKMFNTVLKSEEIATAGELLNNDKNRLASDIDSVDTELQAQKSLLGASKNITPEMIDYLKEHDGVLDSCISNETFLYGIQTTKSTLDGIPVIPEVSTIDAEQLGILGKIESLVKGVDSIVVYPEVPNVDYSELTALLNIASLNEGLQGLIVTPEISEVSNEQLLVLQSLMSIMTTIDECSEIVNSAEANLTELNAELEKLQSELATRGVKMVKCPGCGQIFNPDEQHLH